MRSVWPNPEVPFPSDGVAMFTGLVQDVAGVIDASVRGATQRLVLVTRLPLSRFEMGASVACNGVCLTVVGLHDVPATGETLLEFDVGPETLRVSRLGALKKGDRVNLEPALRVGDPIGGHDVTGHVDALLPVHSFQEWEEGFWKLEIEVRGENAHYLVPKGSIAIRGTSLTVAEISQAVSVRDGSPVTICGIMLVPHTLANTTLGVLASRDEVEVEFDRTVKAIASLLRVMVPHLLPKNPSAGA